MPLNHILCKKKGARVVGETNIETELWASARDQLISLFDSTDFHVATALARMFDYSVSNGRRDQGDYSFFLFILCLKVLERIGIHF